jgi:hypothetical protein
MVSTSGASLKVSSVSFFFEKVWKSVATARQGLPKFPKPQCSAGQTNVKANKRQSCMYVARLSFIFPYLHKGKKEK